MLRLFVLCLPLLSGACQSQAPVPALADDPMPDTGGSDAVEVRQIRVERAYTLEDPREQDFKARVAAEAAVVCGSAAHTIVSTRPFGPERIGEDFLYRMIDVGITCTSAPGT